VRVLRRSCRFALIVACLAAPAHAGALRLEPWRGHVSFGYARLFSDDTSPGGSISVAGGVDYPIRDDLRIGPGIAISLLGTRDVTRGSVIAGLDHSLLEGVLQLHWLPRTGHITRVSFGPGLAVDEVRPELALDVSALPRRQKIVAVGLEAGARWVPVERVDWYLTTLRLTIHY
jgi:hypothetical protein